MKPIRKRFVAFLLIIFLFANVFSLNTIAATDSATLSVASVTGSPGDTVKVDIVLSDNPGLASLKFDVIYDEYLTLNNVELSSNFGSYITTPEPYTNPQTITLISPLADVTTTGVLATLEFAVADNAPNNYVAEIKVGHKPTDIYNSNLEDVDLVVTNGKISIFHGIPGDINEDKVVNTRDAVLLFRYVAGWNVDVDLDAVDVTGDGVVNTRDAVMLFRYVAGWEGIVLHRGKVCSHQMTATAAKAATCTEDGNTAYWYCSLCEKYFSDANGTVETTLDKTVIEAPGHNVVVDPSVAPTYDSTGLTEGSHCSVCGTTIVQQVVLDPIPKEEFLITYHIANGDEYLMSQNIINNNPESYTTELGVAKFSNPTVPGYTFLGWYDLPSGNSAENIKSIPAGTTGNFDLYAQWEKIPYKVNFSSELIPVDSETYTVDEEHVLPSPKLDGYIFVGWSDDAGNVIKNIPVGTVGPKTYTANWLSERNQAWAKTELDAPTIYEDDETKTILFAYEIGEIRNVPVSPIYDFGKINSSGVTKTVTTEVSRSISESYMETYSNTVQKATTDSFSWTLSNEWSDSVTVDEEWAKENGLTQEEINTKYRDDNSNWYISNGSSGSTTTSEVSGSDKTTLNSNTKNKTTTDSDTSTEKSSVSAELKATMGSEVTGKIEAGLSASVELEDTHLDSTIKEKSSSNGTNKTEYGSKTTDTNSSWNSETGYGGSVTVGESSTVSTALSQKLSEKYSIGKSYINTDSESSTQGKVTSNSSTEEYSSSVTYSSIVGEKTTETLTTENTASGYHRWVMAGTAHVFAIVGYDIATSSYFVTTYSIMDDDIKEYEDYSYLKSSYDDNENSVIEFQVPYDEIVDYVADRVGKSDGLVFSKSGIVTGYQGTDKSVLIPEYTVIDNNDGTKSVVKVVGISSTAFTGKNIEEIILSDNITEIPDGAFKNCTSLKTISAVGITKIGNEAFLGCTNLEEVIIGENVTELGTNILDGNTKLGVVAANSSVVASATQSGAKEITIAISDKCSGLNDVSFTVPRTCEYFAFYGYDKTFNNFKIESNAKKTIINRVNIVSNTQTPIVISSNDVELHEVNITSPGICIALKSDTTNLALRGESTLTSSSGKSMLCKEIALSRIDASQTTLLTVNGNLLICDSEKCILDGEDFLNVTGEVTGITEREFDSYLKGVFTVNFDANGGTVSQTSKTVIYNSQFGELPVPTRDYYTFEGWYTEVSGGTKVTAEKIMTSTEDITLYAHWTQNDASGWVLASEVPADAEIVNEKWTYDLTTNITSDKSYVAGYTLYNTTSVWGSYGAWSAWSDGAYYASDSRQVETQQVETSRTPHYNYYHRRVSSSSVSPSYTQVQWDSGLVHLITLDYELTKVGTSSENGTPYYGYYSGCSSCPNIWYKCGTYITYTYTYKTQYRYRDRSLVYTYYHTKTEAKESATEVTASDTISNVQHWVKYVAK